MVPVNMAMVVVFPALVFSQTPPPAAPKPLLSCQCAKRTRQHANAKSTHMTHVVEKRWPEISYFLLSRGALRASGVSL